MKKATIVIMGLADIGQALKIYFKYEQRVYQANLIITLLLYLYIGFEVFIETSLLNYYNHPAVIIITSFYFSVSFLFIEMIRVEFNLKKKISLSNSKFIKKTKFLLEKTEKKYINPVKKISFEERINERVFVLKNQIDTINQKIINKEFKAQIEKNRVSKIANKIERHEKDITKLKNKALISDTLEYYDIKNIKALFNYYKEDLFENLDIKRFIEFMFTNPRENSGQQIELSKIEKRNIISVIILLVQNEKIKGSVTLIFELLNGYTNLNLTRKTLNNYFNQDFNLTKYKNIEQLKHKISKIKNK